jgi:uncharacterized protein YndB with AHSA1/START domain
MKRLEYKIDIAAPAEKVWKTMLDKETYDKWTSVSWPGASYQGKWGKGENIRFASEDGSGTLATIIAFEPYSYIDCEHIAVLLSGGIEDKDSDLAKGWVGTKEAYRFTEENGNTQLLVTLNINPDWEKMFNEGWPNALNKLKEICEH